MKYKVTLRLFEDDMTGDWGVAPKNSLDMDQHFNAFWRGIGIFHDIFEHGGFEGIHKYFLGDYGFNIGGEVAAMGHLAYYHYNYRMDERMPRGGMYSIEDSIISSTEGMMTDGITYGNFDFGWELMCKVPRVREIGQYNYNYLENIIQDHYYKIKEAHPKKQDNYDTEEEMKRRREYKKSITLGKLRSLYTWGWKRAEKIAPFSNENTETLKNFIIFWNKFCQENDAKELGGMFRDIEFTITTGENLKWNAVFISHGNERINYKDVYQQEFELNY